MTVLNTVYCVRDYSQLGPNLTRPQVTAAPQSVIADISGWSMQPQNQSMRP